VNIKEQNIIFLNSISLIASENYSFYYDFSDIYFSDIWWRYSFLENKLFQKSFPWHEQITKLHEKVINDFKKLLKSSFLTISPLSWMNALLSILMSFTKYWDLVYFIPVEFWWHSSSTKIAEKLWLRIKYIPFDNNTKKINFNLFRNELEKDIPKLIYVDQMTWIYPISLLKIKDIVDNNNIITYNDISHNWAFVISWFHCNPLNDWYLMFWWSTHKTIPWPQKAFITSNNELLYNKLIENLNFLVSNNNQINIFILWKVLSKMDWKWNEYTSQIIKNSFYFSKKIKELGFELVYDWLNFSQNHQVLFFTEPILKSNIFFKKLSNIWIFVNFLPLPFSNWRVGIRVWLQEFTFLWWKEKDLDILINIFRDIILNEEINLLSNKNIVSNLKKELLIYFKNSN